MKETVYLPPEIEQALLTLNRKGFKSYVVGGCVRDSLLNKKPKDWDITTSAMPKDVKTIFSKTVDTGLQHGTVTLLLEKNSVEVTTFRADGVYLDHRRPERVRFSDVLEEDLKRRDFTVNSIAYHPQEGCIDPFGGRKDLQRKIIRAVGDPHQRFLEDALRMLRAVRFSAQLDFAIDPATFEAIREHAKLLLHISKERIRDELSKLLLSDSPMKFMLLKEANALQYILPEFQTACYTRQHHPHHAYTVAIHSMHAVSHIENRFHLRWAMLLHDLGKTVTRTTDEKGIDHFYGHVQKSVEIAEKILARLKFDNQSTKKILALLKHHDRVILPTPKSVRKALFKVGEDIFNDLLKVKQADAKAQAPKYIRLKLLSLDQIEKTYREIVGTEQCFTLKTLAINGDDLIAIGFTPGKHLGIVLHRLLETVLENPEQNQKESLLELAKAMSSSQKNRPPKSDP